jgi:hypothetical protein
MKARVEQDLADIHGNRALVKSFFRAQSVAYVL